MSRTKVPRCKDVWPARIHSVQYRNPEPKEARGVVTMAKAACTCLGERGG